MKKAQMASEATLFYSALGAVHGGRDGHSAFQRTLKEMNDG